MRFLFVPRCNDQTLDLTIIKMNPWVLDVKHLNVGTIMVLIPIVPTDAVFSKTSD